MSCHSSPRCQTAASTVVHCFGLRVGLSFSEQSQKPSAILRAVSNLKKHQKSQEPSLESTPSVPPDSTPAPAEHQGPFEARCFSLSLHEVSISGRQVHHSEAVEEQPLASDLQVVSEMREPRPPHHNPYALHPRPNI